MFEKPLKRDPIPINLNVRVSVKINDKLEEMAGLLNIPKSEVVRTIIYNSIDLFEEQQKKLIED